MVEGDDRGGEVRDERPGEAPADPAPPAGEGVGSSRERGEGDPAGSPYDWYVRGTALLEAGDANAAALLLGRLLTEEPWSRSVLEALARALYDARRYEEAAQAFGDLVDRAPDSDYAHFGLGLSLWRLQRFHLAGEHLAMASVMRPGRAEYQQALAQVRATQAARAEAGLAPEGPLSLPPRLPADGRDDGLDDGLDGGLDGGLDAGPTGGASS